MLALASGISHYRVSVCLFVSVTRRYCTKNAKRRIMQTMSRDSPGTSYLTQSLVGDAHSLCNLRSVIHAPFRTQRFRASTVRAGAKCSISTNRSRPRAFERAIDEPCTLPLDLMKGGTKRDFAVFTSKIQLLSKEVCCSLHSCVVWKLPEAKL